jgi:RNA polymerase sigma-B factor
MTTTEYPMRRGKAQFEEYQRTRDGRLRDRIVADNVPLAYAAARRFFGRGAESEDLQQVALLALVEAVDRFDPSRGASFSSFAVPTIEGTLKRHLRDRTWHVRPARALQERILTVAAATERLTNRLGRAPAIDEIADEIGAAPSDVRKAMDAGMVRYAQPLPVYDADQSPAEFAWIDRRLGGAEDRVDVAELLSRLPERERRIVQMRYFDDMRQGSIAERFGLSQVQVSRLLERSMTTLRSAAPDVVDDYESVA